MVAFFYIALYLGGWSGLQYHVVPGGATFAACMESARFAESGDVPFDEERPITSECFYQVGGEAK